MLLLLLFNVATVVLSDGSIYREASPLAPDVSVSVSGEKKKRICQTKVHLLILLICVLQSREVIKQSLCIFSFSFSHFFFSSDVLDVYIHTFFSFFSSFVSLCVSRTSANLQRVNQLSTSIKRQSGEKAGNIHVNGALRPPPLPINSYEWAAVNRETIIVLVCAGLVSRTSSLLS